jgi:hypothetical protein
MQQHHKCCIDAGNFSVIHFIGGLLSWLLGVKGPVPWVPKRGLVMTIWNLLLPTITFVCYDLLKCTR